MWQNNLYRIEEAPLPSVKLGLHKEKQELIVINPRLFDFPPICSQRRHKVPQIKSNKKYLR